SLLVQRPQVAEGVPEALPPDTVAGVSVVDWHFLPSPAVHQELDLGLEKVGAAANPVGEHRLQGLAAEALEPAGHVAHAGTQQEVGEEPASPADEVARPRSGVAAAVDEPAAADVVVPFLHAAQEQRYLLGKMAQPTIHLEDPAGAGVERLAIAAEVGIDNAAVLGRPDQRDLRGALFPGLHHLPGSIAGHAVHHAANAVFPS